MINRKLQSVTVKGPAHESTAPYNLTVDSYGQITYEQTARTIQMATWVYSQQNVQDPRYIDVEMVGLTHDAIAPGEIVTLAQGDFRVKYVVPTERWQEVLLTKL